MDFNPPLIRKKKKRFSTESIIGDTKSFSFPERDVLVSLVHMSVMSFDFGSVDR